MAFSTNLYLDGTSARISLSVLIFHFFCFPAANYSYSVDFHSTIEASGAIEPNPLSYRDYQICPQIGFSYYEFSKCPTESSFPIETVIKFVVYHIPHNNIWRGWMFVYTWYTHIYTWFVSMYRVWQVKWRIIQWT